MESIETATTCFIPLHASLGIGASSVVSFRPPQKRKTCLTKTRSALSLLASFSIVSKTSFTGPFRLGSPLSTIASVLSTRFEMRLWGLKAVDMAKRKMPWGLISAFGR